MRFNIVLILSACILHACSSLDSVGPVQFRTHVIEASIPSGYAVLVADFNNDQRPDVIGLTSRITELAWYENPNWDRHVLVRDMNGLVNMAAYDIDDDGIPELAIENEFSMVAAESQGSVWLLQNQGDPRKPWKAIKVDELTTSHHVAWADIDGDGKKELINAPLIGAKALAPRYEGQVPLFYYQIPKDLQSDWKRLMITDQLTGVLHRVRVTRWNGGDREQLLTTGFDGIVLHQAFGRGDNIRWESNLISKGHKCPSPRAGASDVAVARLKEVRILVSVEPWHGNEVVVYIQDKSEHWKRRVIFDELVEGHEVCVGDFNGDGRDDIVVGDRSGGREISSSHIFYAQDDTGAQWHHKILDPLGMSASGCSVADINGDGRDDIVMIGGASADIKWYENLGPDKQ